MSRARDLADSADLSFDSGTLVIDSANNRVGIGTTSPSANLHIEGSTPVLRIRSSADTESGLLHFADQSSNFSGVIAYDHSDNHMGFYTNALERMVIDSSGNVGIGVDPQSFAKLQVKTDTNKQIAMFSNANGATVGGITDVGGSTTLRLAGSPLVMTGGGGSGATHVTVDTSGNLGINCDPDFKLEVEEAGTGSGLGGIASSTATAGGNAGYRWVTGGTTRFGMTTIGSAGSESLRIYDNNNSSTRLTLDASGNLLVGKTTTATTTAGSRLASDGLVVFSRDTTSGSATLVVNKQTNDGTVVAIQKDGSTVGSIALQSNQLEINGNPSAVTTVRFGTTATIYPNTDAVGDLGAGTRRFKDLYLSGGVYLGGTGAANHLDDYEEGTFTTTISGTSVGQGVYRKIGDLVFIDIVLTANSISTSTIEGLPFNITSGSGYAGLLFGRMSQCDVLDGNGVPCRMAFNYDTILFRQNSLNANDSSFTITSSASGTVRIGISGVGRVF